MHPETLLGDGIFGKLCRSVLWASIPKAIVGNDLKDGIENLGRPTSWLVERPAN